VVIEMAYTAEQLRMLDVWYRGDACNFMPSAEETRTPTGRARCLVLGFAPDRPFINKTTVIASFGSCFSQHISDYLFSKGYSVITHAGSNPAAHAFHTESSASTFALKQQLEWAFGLKEADERVWYLSPAEPIHSPAGGVEMLGGLLKTVEVFILTPGISEVWSDKITGNVFFKAVPKHVYNPDIHEFRVSSVEENRNNIRGIIQIIKNSCPTAKIVFSVSPVPLVATFRPISCIAANTVSKAILRVALDEVARENIADVYYWPGYEAIKECFRDNPYLEDHHHVDPVVLDEVMSMFSAYYLSGE
jgi:hypothetical protein